MTEAGAPAGPATRALRSVGDALARVPPALALALAVGWAALVWRWSSRPAPDTPGGPLWALVGNLVHAPLFAVLALLVLLALPRPRGTWPSLGRAEVALALAAATLYGAVDEWHQALVPERTASARDVLTDAVGAAAALWVAAHVAHGGTEPGLRLRLAAGTAACLTAAALATTP